jgi:hypothetical protein
LAVTNTLPQNFNHATIVTASSKEKSWQQVVFTEAVQQERWLLRLVQKLQVYMAVELYLAVHILSGLSFKSQPLRQQLLQLLQVGQVPHLQAQQTLFGFQLR